MSGSGHPPYPGAPRFNRRVYAIACMGLLAATEGGDVRSAAKFREIAQAIERDFPGETNAFNREMIGVQVNGGSERAQRVALIRAHTANELAFAPGSVTAQDRMFLLGEIDRLRAMQWDEQYRS